MITALKLFGGLPGEGSQPLIARSARLLKPLLGLAMLLKEATLTKRQPSAQLWKRDLVQARGDL